MSGQFNGLSRTLIFTTTFSGSRANCTSRTITGNTNGKPVMFQFIANAINGGAQIKYGIGFASSSANVIAAFNRGTSGTKSTIAWTEIANTIIQRVPIYLTGANAAEYINVSVPGSIIYEIADSYSTVTTITGTTTINIYALNI